MTLLLTLATGSLRKAEAGEESAIPDLLDLPLFAIERLGLRGLNVDAAMLSGWSLPQLDQLRDRADKAACPCLVLVDRTPLEFASKKAATTEAARQRVIALAAAANRLGCNAMSIRCAGDDTDEAFETTAGVVKSLMPAVERMELNLLLSPADGLTNDAGRLTDLIKRIGGFRIGSLPTFEHAAASGDLVETLRKLSPYAGAIHATVRGFNGKGAHDGFDLAECVETVRSVGYLNTLAIDFVGDGDAVAAIEQARDVLQAAIDGD